MNIRKLSRWLWIWFVSRGERKRYRRVSSYVFLLLVKHGENGTSMCAGDDISEEKKRLVASHVDYCQLDDLSVRVCVN